MTKLQEKRHHPRHHGQGRITLLHVHCQTRQIMGRLINFSEQGIRFFCDRPLSPGTTIIVRASGESYRHMSPHVGCQLRSMGVCTVKWCQEVVQQDTEYHDMGAAYFMPY